jgi:hypothetical protein
LQPGDGWAAEAGVAGVVTVLEALDGELAAMPAEVGGSSLAMSARVLAGKLDDVGTAASAAAACAKELREHLAGLRALAPVETDEDDVDRLQAAARKKLKVVG